MRVLTACPLARGPFPPARRLCDWCAAPLTGRQRRWCEDHAHTFMAQHSWSSARRAALARDGFQCRRCDSPDRLEVHHRVPVLGRHGLLGCWHHLDGLETLCRAHHLAITAEQFGHRRRAERIAVAMRTPSLFDA